MKFQLEIHTTAIKLTEFLCIWFKLQNDVRYKSGMSGKKVQIQVLKITTMLKNGYIPLLE